MTPSLPSPHSSTPSGPKFRVVGSCAPARMAARLLQMAHPTRTPFQRRLPRTGALAAALLLCSIPVAAQGQLDQVSYRDSNGRARTWHGTVTENSLERTVIEARGRTRNVESERVDLVYFGDVPESYREARSYLDRGDFENAAARFQVAAGESEARDVVRASARFLAGKTQMRAGANDPSAFQKAIAQFDTFLTDFPNDREVPEARSLRARAMRLTGDPAGAAQAYRELYQEGVSDSPTKGYPLLLCAKAGIAAAECLIEAGDPSGASALYNEISAALTSHLAGLDDNAPSRFALGEVLAEARLGEGFSLLAQGSDSQARTFFQGQLSSAPKAGAQRYGARLGLAEALLAAGSVRDAEIEFAQVSALEPANRDRIARALLGLASCAEKLSDTKAPAQRKLWLETLTNRYGDTPSALRAQELLKSL
ncbi:MAG TPA: tetratricopeptide repeat protein [Planctomycetes bacterium]|nr:tetratricopeptide repeat protein [Planctomycetota bacterium]